jgi:hypothetical protein
VAELSVAGEALAAAVHHSPEISVDEHEGVFAELPPETWERWAQAASESTRDALAELSTAATAFLRAEPEGLVRLIRARNRADEVLGVERERRCKCNLASGFHDVGCAVANA